MCNDYRTNFYKLNNLFIFLTFLSATTVNYARDKGRSKVVVVGIFVTIAISILIIQVAKYQSKGRHLSIESEMNAKHAAYSKHHQEALKSTYK